MGIIEIPYVVKWEGGKNGNALLYFPTYSANSGNIVHYAHIGQHGESDLSYYRGLKNCLKDYQKADADLLVKEYEKNMLMKGRVLKRVYKDSPKFREERYSHV